MNYSKRYLGVLLLLSVFVCSSVTAQTILTNKITIDKKRYDPITGSPYYFDNHQKAKIYIKGDSKPYEVTLNINLQENELEAFEGDRYAVIDPANIAYVEFGESSKVLFIKNKIIIQYYKSDRYQLMDYPRISIRESTHRPPGEVIIKKKFDIKSDFKVFIDGSPQSIEIKKKSIIRALGKDAEQIAKKSKNKLKSIEDLVSLLGKL